MARRNTVNFLQIEHGLEDAIRACQDNPDAPFAEGYRDRLDAVSTELVETTRRTDRTYLAWREAMKQRLLAAKHLSARFDALRDEVGEYGVAARPDGRVGYWAPDELLQAARTFVEQLAALSGAEVPESDDWAAELRLMIQTLERALREEEQSLEDYKRIAPLRRQAIYRAMHAVDEFESTRRDYQS